MQDFIVFGIYIGIQKLDSVVRLCVGYVTTQIFFKVAILFRIPFLPAVRASKPSRSELIFDVNVLHFSYSQR